MRLTLQRHANVDVHFVLGQPDIVDGAETRTGADHPAVAQAYSLLLVRTCWVRSGSATLQLMGHGAEACAHLSSSLCVIL
jgi:hypothetical protein